MEPSFFFVWILGILAFTTYITFKRIFPVSILLAITLLFFSSVIPAIALPYIQFVVLCSIAFLVYKAVSTRYTS